MSAATVNRPRRHATAALAGGVSLFLRRLRLEPASALTTFLLVAGAAFLFAALPRLFDSFADDGLRYAVEHAPPPARQVQVADTGRAAPAKVAGRVAGTERALPPSLRAVVHREGYVVRSPLYLLERDVRPIRQGLFRYLTLRLQPGARAHVRLVAGRYPAATARTVDAPVAQPVLLNRLFPPESAEVSGFPKSRRVTLLEVALSTQTARALRLHVGDRAVFSPDLTDLAVQLAPIRDQLPLALEVTGLFVVDRPDEPFWFGDEGLATPAVRLSQSGDLQEVFAQALVPEDAYPRMLSATRPLRLTYGSNYVVDPDRLDARRTETLVADLAQLESQYSGATPLDRQVTAGLSPVLERDRKQRSQAETLLGVAAIGLFACAVACLGLLAALSHERRRTETGLSRTRGASPHQLLAAQAAEGLLIAAPAGFAGWAAATLAVDGRGSPLSASLVLAIVVATALLPVAAISGVARRPLGAPEREDVVALGPSPRRLAVEALIVVAAGLGVYLLRRRGLGGGGRGFDPYLAAVPVLLGLACGVVALRLYPLPLAAIARLARRGRGLPLHLGLSRAARRPDATSLPLLVLVLALAIATFAAAMSSTLRSGQERSSWRAIGADLRVDAPDGALPSQLVTRLARLGDVAPAHVDEAGTGQQGGVLLALDPAAYERVVSGTPAAVRIPKALDRLPPIPQLVPALVSADNPGGGTFETAAGGEVTLLATATRDEFPGVPRATPFAVVSLPAVEKAGGIAPTNRIYVRGADADEVRRIVHAVAPAAEVHSRAAIVDALGVSPLASGVRRGFLAAVVLAGVFAAVALALMALIAARSRARDLALVRTMGGSQREGILLAAVELAPFAATALALGIGLGVAIPYLVAPSLDLAFYTGSRSNPISIPWLPPTAFALGVLALAVVAVLVAGARMRSARLDRVLRIGER
ncbi:MAG TPA: FtsX-like permease family protein [Gaiellaceae bacterium]|nr:FtsX-like permease family protein [Gaiellaceae bacterium]